MRQELLSIIFLFFIIGISGCINQTDTVIKVPVVNESQPIPSGLSGLPAQSGGQNLVVSPVPGSSGFGSSCPPALTRFPELSGSPRDLPPQPDVYYISNPDEPTMEDYAAVPVDYAGTDRLSLVKIAFSNICVRDFLRSGGSIIGISGQARPLRKNETQAYPPALYGYRRVNYTEMFVRFDIDPVAGNISRISVDIR